MLGTCEPERSNTQSLTQEAAGLCGEGLGGGLHLGGGYYTITINWERECGIT